MQSSTASQLEVEGSNLPKNNSDEDSSLSIDFVEIPSEPAEADKLPLIPISDVPTFTQHWDRVYGNLRLTDIELD